MFHVLPNVTELEEYSENVKDSIPLSPSLLKIALRHFEHTVSTLCKANYERSGAFPS